MHPKSNIYRAMSIYCLNSLYILYIVDGRNNEKSKYIRF